MIVACFANNIQSQHRAELVKCSNEMKRAWQMALYKWIEAIIDHQSSTQFHLGNHIGKQQQRIMNMLKHIRASQCIIGFVMGLRNELNIGN